MATEISSEMRAAETEVAALRVKLQAARETDLPPAEGHALFRRLHNDLKAAEARCTAVAEAHVAAARTKLEAEARAAREASAQARAEARRHTVDATRAVVRELLPHVEQVNRLNGRLEALRGQLGGSIDTPLPFRPYVFDSDVWIVGAKRFIGDG